LIFTFDLQSYFVSLDEKITYNLKTTGQIWIWVYMAMSCILVCSVSGIKLGIWPWPLTLRTNVDGSVQVCATTDSLLYLRKLCNYSLQRINV